MRGAPDLRRWLAPAGARGRGVVGRGLPISVAVHDNLVYVANARNGGSNQTGFWLRRDGRLTPIAGSTVALPDGSQPGDILFNANGTKLAGTRNGTSLIDSFSVGDDSRLAAAPARSPSPRPPAPWSYSALPLGRSISVPAAATWAGSLNRYLAVSATGGECLGNARALARQQID